MTTATETKAVAKTSPAVLTMQNLIETYKPQMSKLLGKHMDVERLMQIALLALGRNPKLLECTGASVLGCVLEASRLGLQAGAGAGETWLVPFKNSYTGKMEAQLIIDYRGIIKLIKESAGVGAIMADAVCENDTFSYGVYDSKQFLEWKPGTGGKGRGNVVGYFAASWDTKEKITGIVYKTIQEIEDNHRARSKAKDSGPWKVKGSGDYAAMCIKSVIRPLAKLNPYSSGSVSRAVALDEMADMGKPQDLALLADPASIATPEEKTYSMPQMTGPETTKEKPEKEGSELLFKVEGVATTEEDGATVWVIRTTDKEKLYTDSEEFAQTAGNIAKSGGEASAIVVKDGAKKWLISLGQVKA